MNLCPTCNKPADKPYRNVVDGHIVGGCIDNFHSGAYLSEADWEWHTRDSAMAWRTDILCHNADVVLGRA